MNNAEFVIILISIITGTAYSILIISFTLGWFKIKKGSIHESPSTFISIVVPVRNEQENIDTLIQNLLSQDYPRDFFEIIIVNDHSTDDTADKLIKHEGQDGVCMLELTDEQSGKKSAINLGIQHARGILITTLDADCIPGMKWLKSISSCYESGMGYKMIAGPVAIHKPSGLLSSFQAIELLSLVASGAGAIGIKRPIMCNGANFSYEKEAYLAVEGFKGSELIAGGDDMFLMEKINEKYPAEAIGFNTNPEGIVYTKAVRSLKEFLNQRFRWVAKSSAYKNPFLISSAIIVLLFNLCLLAALVFAFISLTGLLIFGSMFLLKCIVDFPILWKATKFSGQTHLIGNYISFQFVYFIFISLSGILGNLISFTWKGRK